jgi:hypothetical protein
MVLTALWREGNDQGEGSSHSARVTGLALLGRHLGLFERDKQQMTAIADLARLLDQRRARLLGEGRLPAVATLAGTQSVVVVSMVAREPSLVREPKAAPEAPHPLAGCGRPWIGRDSGQRSGLLCWRARR